MLFIKAFTSYFHIYRPPTPPTVPSPHRPPPIGLPHRRNTSLCEKTAEERFNTLARGWLAYPVTSMHAHLPPKSGCINVIPRFASLVAERRHSSITRYAKRSVACRDSPRHQPLRAGGTPLPRHRRLPHHIVRHPSDCPIGKKPPKSGFIR